MMLISCRSHLQKINWLATSRLNQKADLAAQTPHGTIRREKGFKSVLYLTANVAAVSSIVVSSGNSLELAYFFTLGLRERY
jgi:hypothetical protein